VSEQDKRPPNRGNFDYGEDPSMTKLAIENIEATIKAKYEKKERDLPSPERITRMAEIAHRRSLRKGNPKNLG
jgi:hypothetical protein